MSKQLKSKMQDNKSSSTSNINNTRDSNNTNNPHNTGSSNSKYRNHSKRNSKLNLETIPDVMKEDTATEEKNYNISNTSNDSIFNENIDKEKNKTINNNNNNNTSTFYNDFNKYLKDNKTSIKKEELSINDMKNVIKNNMSKNRISLTDKNLDVFNESSKNDNKYHHNTEDIKVKFKKIEKEPINEISISDKFEKIELDQKRNEDISELYDKMIKIREKDKDKDKYFVGEVEKEINRFEKDTGDAKNTLNVSIEGINKSSINDIPKLKSEFEKVIRSKETLINDLKLTIMDKDKQIEKLFVKIDEIKSLDFTKIIEFYEKEINEINKKNSEFVIYFETNIDKLFTAYNKILYHIIESDLSDQEHLEKFNFNLSKNDEILKIFKKLKSENHLLSNKINELKSNERISNVYKRIIPIFEEKINLSEKNFDVTNKNNNKKISKLEEELRKAKEENSNMKEQIKKYEIAQRTYGFDIFNNSNKIEHGGNNIGNLGNIGNINSMNSMGMVNNNLNNIGSNIGTLGINNLGTQHMGNYQFLNPNIPGNNLKSKKEISEHYYKKVNLKIKRKNTKSEQNSLSNSIENSGLVDDNKGKNKVQNIKTLTRSSNKDNKKGIKSRDGKNDENQSKIADKQDNNDYTDKDNEEQKPINSNIAITNSKSKLKKGNNVQIINNNNFLSFNTINAKPSNEDDLFDTDKLTIMNFFKVISTSEMIIKNKGYLIKTSLKDLIDFSKSSTNIKLIKNKISVISLDVSNNSEQMLSQFNYFEKKSITLFKFFFSILTCLVEQMEKISEFQQSSSKIISEDDKKNKLNSLIKEFDKIKDIVRNSRRSIYEKYKIDLNREFVNKLN